MQNGSPEYQMTPKRVNCIAMIRSIRLEQRGRKPNVKGQLCLPHTNKIESPPNGIIPRDTQ